MAWLLGGPFLLSTPLKQLRDETQVETRVSSRLIPPLGGRATNAGASKGGHTSNGRSGYIPACSRIGGLTNREFDASKIDRPVREMPNPVRLIRLLPKLYSATGIYRRRRGTAPLASRGSKPAPTYGAFWPILHHRSDIPRHRHPWPDRIGRGCRGSDSSREWNCGGHPDERWGSRSCNQARGQAAGIDVGPPTLDAEESPECAHSRAPGHRVSA